MAILLVLTAIVFVLCFSAEAQQQKKVPAGLDISREPVNRRKRLPIQIGTHFDKDCEILVILKEKMS